MKQLLVPGIIAALMLVAYALYITQPAVQTSMQPQGDANSAPAPEPKLAIDLYPLFPGAAWNPTRAESLTIGTTTYAGAGAVSEPTDAAVDQGSISMPFEQYYSELLISRGWRIDYNLAAGGHNGGQDGYRNGPGLILVRYNFEYQNQPTNAPSECPCTVELSLFSNVGN